jgi:hypothetical protein
VQSESECDATNSPIHGASIFDIRRDVKVTPMPAHAARGRVTGIAIPPGNSMAVFAQQYPLEHSLLLRCSGHPHESNA